MWLIYGFTRDIEVFTDTKCNSEKVMIGIYNGGLL